MWGRVDTTGNSEEPEEGRESLRKEGWRGDGKEKQRSVGQGARDREGGSSSALPLTGCVTLSNSLLVSGLHFLLL